MNRERVPDDCDFFIASLYACDGSDSKIQINLPNSCRAYKQNEAAFERALTTSEARRFLISKIMKRKPWIEESFLNSPQASQMPTYTTNSSKLAKSLGVDDVSCLPLGAQKKIEDYLADPALTTRWLLDQEDYSVSDLFHALTYKIEKDDDIKKSVSLEIAGYREDLGDHVMRYDTMKSFTIYLSRAFLRASQYSKEADSTIRWYLYNEDYLFYMSGLLPSAENLIEILNVRSLDFFIPQINSSEWNDSWNTEAIFEQLQFLIKASEFTGQFELARNLKEKIERKKRAYLQVQGGQNYDKELGGDSEDLFMRRCGASRKVDFIGAVAPSLLGFIGLKKTPSPKNLRKQGETEWRKYLGAKTWKSLHVESQKNLIDEFISRQATEQGLYSNWILSITPLLRVVERELNMALLPPLKRYIETSHFVCSSDDKKGQFKKKTFEVIQNVHKNGKSLTLGELEFVMKFWNNPRMDKHTELFQNTRNYLKEKGIDSTALVHSIEQCFQQSFFPGEPPWDLVKLRNSCAHPGDESYFENPQLHQDLYSVLGEPPKKLLQMIVLQLRV